MFITHQEENTNLLNARGLGAKYFKGAFYKGRPHSRGGGGTTKLMWTGTDMWGGESTPQRATAISARIFDTKIRQCMARCRDVVLNCPREEFSSMRKRTYADMCGHGVNRGYKNAIKMKKKMRTSFDSLTNGGALWTYLGHTDCELH